MKGGVPTVKTLSVALLVSATVWLAGWALICGGCRRRDDDAGARDAVDEHRRQRPAGGQVGDGGGSIEIGAPDGGVQENGLAVF